MPREDGAGMGFVQGPIYTTVTPSVERRTTLWQNKRPAPGVGESASDDLHVPGEAHIPAVYYEVAPRPQAAQERYSGVQYDVTHTNKSSHASSSDIYPTIGQQPNIHPRRLYALVFLAIALAGVAIAISVYALSQARGGGVSSASLAGVAASTADSVGQLNTTLLGAVTSLAARLDAHNRSASAAMAQAAAVTTALSASVGSQLVGVRGALDLLNGSYTMEASRAVRTEYSLSSSSVVVASSLSTALASEVARASTSERSIALQAANDISGEASRAALAEQQVSAAVSAERSRAVGLEASLAASIRLGACSHRPPSIAQSRCIILCKRLII